MKFKKLNTCNNRPVGKTVAPIRYQTWTKALITLLCLDATVNRKIRIKDKNYLRLKLYQPRGKQKFPGG